MNDFTEIASFAEKASGQVYWFEKGVLELECGCYAIPLHYIPGANWMIKLELKGRCVRFGCRVTTLQVRSKSANVELGKTLATTRARRPDPLALELSKLG